MAATLVKPGDTIFRDHGHLRLTFQLNLDSVAITVMYGPNRSGPLSKTFELDRVPAARIWWGEIARLADAGTHILAIEAALTAIHEAAVAAQLQEVR